MKNNGNTIEKSKLGRKGLFVSPGLIFSILHEWRKMGTISLPKFDLPIDANLVSVSWEPLKESFLLIVEHKSFKSSHELGTEIDIVHQEYIEVLHFSTKTKNLETTVTS